MGQRFMLVCQIFIAFMMMSVVLPQSQNKPDCQWAIRRRMVQSCPSNAFDIPNFKELLPYKPKIFTKSQKQVKYIANVHLNHAKNEYKVPSGVIVIEETNDGNVTLHGTIYDLPFGFYRLQIYKFDESSKNNNRLAKGEMVKDLGIIKSCILAGNQTVTKVHSVNKGISLDKDKEKIKTYIVGRSMVIRKELPDGPGDIISKGNIIEGLPQSNTQTVGSDCMAFNHAVVFNEHASWTPLRDSNSSILKYVAVGSLYVDGYRFIKGSMFIEETKDGYVTIHGAVDKVPFGEHRFQMYQFEDPNACKPNHFRLPAGKMNLIRDFGFIQSCINPKKDGTAYARIHKIDKNLRLDEDWKACRMLVIRKHVPGVYGIGGEIFAGGRIYRLHPNFWA